MKVCFIGGCGHQWQALKYLRTRKDVLLCGFAPASAHEGFTASISSDLEFYPDHISMLEHIKPDLAIISPVFAQTGSIIIECARRGIDVFAEKPVASSLEELELVEKAVRDSGIRFCAMHYLRYDKAFYHGARAVKAGEIGDIILMNAQKSYKYGKRPSWYADHSLYGGTIPWVGIHAFDWIYHFSEKKVLSVQAQCIGADPEMAAICKLDMEDGVMASVSIDYYRPEGAPTHGDDRIRCVGTKGVLEVRDGRITLINKEGVREIAADGCPELLEEFLENRCPISPEEIFYITRISLCARMSADEGRCVYL